MIACVHQLFTHLLVPTVLVRGARKWTPLGFGGFAKSEHPSYHYIFKIYL